MTSREELIKAAAAAIKDHRIECTGLGEVTCRGCRSLGWMTWSEHETHVSQAVIHAVEPIIRADERKQIAAAMACTDGCRPDGSTT